MNGLIRRTTHDARKPRKDQYRRRTHRKGIVEERSGFLQNNERRARGRGPSVEPLTKLFVSYVSIRSSNYRAFQFDRVKQSSHSKLHKPASMRRPVLNRTRKNWFRERRTAEDRNCYEQIQERNNTNGRFYRERLNRDQPSSFHFEYKL